jgi:sphingosine kinase
VGWGILADIDIESEVIRSIGESRFTLWSLLRIAKLKTYNAQLSYTLLGRNKSRNTDPGVGDENENRPPATETLIEGDFVSVYASCQSHIGSDIIFAPDATANDQLIHLTYIRGDVGRARITQFLLGLDKGNFIKIYYYIYE